MEKSNDDFSINELMLDKECLRQPVLVHYWTNREAEEKRRLDFLNAKLEFLKATKAKIERDCDVGKKKKTVGEINEIVLMDSEVQELQKDCIRRKFELDKVKACCITLEHRKKSLELLVLLQGRDYFSTPKPKLNVKP